MKNYAAATYCLVFDIVGSTTQFSCAPESYIKSVQRFLEEISFLIKVIDKGKGDSEVLLSKFTGDGFLILFKNKTDQGHESMMYLLDEIIGYIYLKKKASQIMRLKDGKTELIHDTIPKLELRAALDIVDGGDLVQIQNTELKLDDYLSLPLSRVNRLCTSLTAKNGASIDSFVANKVISLTNSKRKWALPWLQSRSANRFLKTEWIEGRGFGKIDIFLLTHGNSTWIAPDSPEFKAEINKITGGKNAWLIQTPNAFGSGETLTTVAHDGTALATILEL